MVSESWSPLMAKVWPQEQLRVHKLIPNQEAGKAKWEWLSSSLPPIPYPVTHFLVLPKQSTNWG